MLLERIIFQLKPQLLVVNLFRQQAVLNSKLFKSAGFELKGIIGGRAVQIFGIDGCLDTLRLTPLEGVEPDLLLVANQSEPRVLAPMAAKTTASPTPLAIKYLFLCARHLRRLAID